MDVLTHFPFIHRSKLSQEVIPELKESINILKKRLDVQIFHTKSPGSIRSTVSAWEENVENQQNHIAFSISSLEGTESVEHLL